MAFGLALGSTTLAFPLLALEAGFGAGAVGLLAALSAAFQMISKTSLTYLLSRFTDRSLMIVALAIMATSAIALVSTTALIGFIVAQVLQGIARGIFWTAGQTHAVRMPGIAARRLAGVQTVGQLGGLMGPALAGMLAELASLTAALWAAAAMAAIGLTTALTLDALPTYARKPKGRRTPIWKTAGVGLGSWGAAVGGAWRGILDSFVPVILEGAGLSSRVIGGLMTTADGSGLAATAVVAKWGNAGTGRRIPLAASGLALGLVLLPMVDGVLAVAAVVTLCGLCGGFSAVLGTTSVNESALPSDQGAALALVGVYRAAARTAAPTVISGALLVVSLPIALIGTAIGMFAPSAWLRRPARVD